MRRAALAILVPLALWGLAHPEPFAGDWGAIDRPPVPWPGSASGHWLGTDGLGRDLLRLLAVGLVNSLALASSALLGSVAGGAVLGGVVGSLPERLEVWLARGLDLLTAVPLVLLALVMVAAFGRTPMAVALALGLAGLVPVARVTQAAVRQAWLAPDVRLARWQGLASALVLRRHVWPRVAAAVATAAALLWPQLLLSEGMLGFLGLSLRDPATTLGTLLAEGSLRLAVAPWQVVAPTLLLFLLVYLVRPRP